ncbi:MAG TPA: substrate-binding domain-containing protein [Stellaceae bacterium]|jgi:ribose transport system substrate-binding protein
MSLRNLAIGAAALGLGIALATSGYAADLSKVNLAPNKKGTVADLQPMSKFCGTKKIKVALSDGWGGNYWRHITRAEFENEAAKCKNIIETRYTDGEFKPEKQIADIEGLVAQHFDVIVAFLDGGAAITKATREATQAGVAVVPYDTGAASDSFPGKVGRDYVDRVTEDQGEVGQQFAMWLAKTLNGKGNVVLYGGTPGNPMTQAQVAGWQVVFKKYPDIHVLEGGPVPTNWDPALAQQKTAALIAKYPQIDGIYSETTGPVRAFLAAGKPVPAYVGQSLMDLSCLAADNKAKFPKMASMDAHTWMVRLALRKGVAAAEGINNTEPSIITIPFTEDNTSKNPKLAIKCDKSMPGDSIPSSMLSKAEQLTALGGK